MAAALPTAVLAALLLACALAAHPASAAARIVALGDSYTSGQDRIKRANKEPPAPYTETLKACLRQKANDPQLRVDNAGISGAGVLIPPPKNLTTLVERQVELALLRGQPYDLAILWIVGINDMYNSRPQEPFPYGATLKKYLYLVDTVLAQGWRLVVMTQPGFIWAGQYSAMEARRKKMADMVRKAVEADPREVYFFDVETAGLDVWRLSRARQRLLFERDQVHLTRAGAQMIGRRLCAYATPLITSFSPIYSPPGTRSPARSPPRSPSPRSPSPSPHSRSPSPGSPDITIPSSNNNPLPVNNPSPTPL